LRPVKESKGSTSDGQTLTDAFRDSQAQFRTARIRTTNGAWPVAWGEIELVPAP
jgi:hypothetical protein